MDKVNKNAVNNYRAIIELVQNQILSGELKCGDRLPSERALAETLQVSRASVREAFKVLEMMGLLESRQGDGTFIVNRVENYASSALSLAFILDNGTVTDMLKARRCIEMEACRNIITSGDDLAKKTDQLDMYLTKMEGSISQQLRSQLDIGFHSLLVQLSGNLLLVYFANALSQMMTYYIGEITEITEERYAKGTIYNQHKSLVDALRKRDLSATEAVLLQHFMLEEQDYSLLRKRSHWGLRID